MCRALGAAGTGAPERQEVDVGGRPHRVCPNDTYGAKPHQSPRPRSTHHPSRSTTITTSLAFAPHRRVTICQHHPQLTPDRATCEASNLAQLMYGIKWKYMARRRGGTQFPSAYSLAKEQAAPVGRAPPTQTIP